MFFFIFIIVAIILISVIHDYRKKGSDFVVELTLGMGGAHRLTQLLQYIYYFVLLCEIGLYVEFYIGNHSLLRVLGILPTTPFLIEAPSLLAVVFYFGAAAMAGLATLLFFVLPSRFYTMAQLLLFPFLFFLVQSFFHPFNLWEILFENTVIQITALGLVCSLFFLVIIIRVYTGYKVDYEGSKKIKKPGIMIFIWLILILPSCVFAGWILYSYFVFLFSKDISRFDAVIFIFISLNIANSMRLLWQSLNQFFDMLLACKTSKKWF